MSRAKKEKKSEKIDCGVRNNILLCNRKNKNIIN